jgi:hypothetical protein
MVLGENNISEICENIHSYQWVKVSLSFTSLSLTGFHSLVKIFLMEKVVRELFKLANWIRRTIIFCVSGALQIRDSEEKDHGKYECVAENAIGTDYSKSALLYVKGKNCVIHCGLCENDVLNLQYVVFPPNFRYRPSR